MSGNARQCDGPQGGLQLQANVVRRWRWSPAGALLSVPVRCKREQWYLARGFVLDETDSAGLLLEFLRDGETVAERRVELSAVAEAENGEALLGWVQAPKDATHLQVRLSKRGGGGRLDRLLLHPVAERDPKCHPLANVPRWSSYRPALAIDRVVLPASLEALTGCLEDFQIELSAMPRSLRALAAKAIGAACVVDGQWACALGLELSDLERLAAGSLILVDLETFSTLMKRSGAVGTKVVRYTSEHEIMSARVEYADVPTRGFALQDVIPYATLAGPATFQTRVLLASTAWKRYAGETGFATMLASETPWEKKCGDVLSAARPVGQGELIVTDLPWLVAGRYGRLLAPRLAEHLLRMHLAGPIADCVQYWNRWDDCRVMVRDIADMPRWYSPLRAVRWATAESGVARLGVTLPGGGRHLMICTGRIDGCSAHDGLPAEPMVIFMKWLAREVREGTHWTGRFLKDTTVTWQFDTADGLKYALHFDSAAGITTDMPLRTLIVRTEGELPGRSKGCPTDPSSQVLTLPAGVGVFGDRSLAYQARLTDRLRKWIERACG